MNIFHTGVIFWRYHVDEIITWPHIVSLMSCKLIYAASPLGERERCARFSSSFIKKKLIFFKCDKDRMIILCRVIVSYVLGWIKLKTYMRGFQVSVIIYLKSHSHCIETQYKMPFVKIKTRTKHWNFGSLNTN